MTFASIGPNLTVRVGKGKHRRVAVDSSAADAQSLARAEAWIVEAREREERAAARREQMHGFPGGAA